ncbi:MAG: hypothetical protein QOE61_4163 [Micromonosporaceae bacterium]|nr:hypothetical protein [Micromonosporaceae bacterium]
MGGLKRGVGWNGRVSRTERAADNTSARSAGRLSQVRWAVRRDWPDGTHEFIRARDTESDAQHQAQGDRDFWRRCPMRPRLSVVRISVHDFDLHGRHRHNCKAPDCPQQDPAAGSSGVAA